MLDLRPAAVALLVLNRPAGTPTDNQIVEEDWRASIVVNRREDQMKFSSDSCIKLAADFRDACREYWRAVKFEMASTISTS